MFEINCEGCEKPYCCYFKKDKGPVISVRELSKIVENFPLAKENWSKYFVRAENGKYRIRTKGKEKIKCNPLRSKWEDFGEYPCVFLKPKIFGYEIKEVCEIYSFRPTACRLFYC